jgi:quercetin dioxygenase-like cupin family protein
MPTESVVAFHRWAEIPAEAVNPMFDRKLISGERAMLAQVALKKGCLIPLHAHENEQLTCVQGGLLRLVVGEGEAQTFELRSGDVLVIPGNVPHSGEALEDTQVLDVFTPPRADWLQGTDAYLRR